MDMRFDAIERALGTAAPAGAPIDYRCFVAALAAAQAGSATARAAVLAARRLARGTAEPGIVHALDRAARPLADPRPAGSFHRAAALQASATELKPPFTVAFQASFKPAGYTDGIGQRLPGRPR